MKRTALILALSLMSVTVLFAGEAGKVQKTAESETLSLTVEEMLLCLEAVALALRLGKRTFHELSAARFAISKSIAELLSDLLFSSAY